MKKNRLYLVTSLSVATILSLGLTNSRSIKADTIGSDIPSILLEKVKITKNIQSNNEDPLLDGKYVSNGYSDGGYTFLKPTDTSTEHEDSYHLNTKEGWSNDLQTILYDNENKEWDIYYLHTEKVINGNAGAKQNWERVTTKDFIHFSEPTIAIHDLKDDIGDAWSSVWTGSIVTNQGNISGVPKGSKVAFFSGLSNKDNQQNIWAAWSDDNGRTFTHYLKNKYIILDHYWDWTSINRSDERDPAVFYWKGKLIMYAAEGDNIGVYKSENGIDWSVANTNQQDSKIKSSDFLKGLPFEAPVECPVIRSMKTSNGTIKQVLFIGSKSPQKGQTTGTYYIVGHLNDNGIFIPERNAERLDQGTDYYGANFSGNDDLSKADDSLITMGWIGNWNYTNSGIKANQNNYLPNSTRIGYYSLARKIVLNDDLSISSTPLTDNLEKETSQNVSGEVAKQVTEKNNYYKVLDLAKQPANSNYNFSFSTKNGKNYLGAIKIEFRQGKDNNFIIFDPQTGLYRVAGESSELSGGAADYYKNGLASGLGYINDSGLKEQKEIKFSIYTDKNSIELFFPNGKTYTTARFCVNNIQDIKVVAQDPNKNNLFNISYNQVGSKLIGYEEKSNIPSNPNIPSIPGNSNQVDDNSTIKNSTNTEKPVDKVKTKPSVKIKKISLIHPSYVYDENGRRTSKKLQAGSIIKTYGIKIIKNKKYLSLGKDKYIIASNAIGTTRKLKHNTYAYNGKLKRIKFFRRNKKIITYGQAILIKGKKYYLIDKNIYVKKSVF